MGVKICVVVILCIASLGQALNYVNTPIPGAESGLHYEAMGNVRFTTAEWKFGTYVNLVRLVSQRPIITENTLQKVNQTCQFHESSEVCTILLRGGELLEKSLFVDNLLKQLNDSLQNDLSMDDTTKESDGSEIQAQLHHIHDELDKLRNQTLLAGQQLDEAFDAIQKNDKRVTYYLMVDRLQGWTQHFQVEFNYYIDFLQTVIETIHSAKIGAMHPALFSFEKLENVVSQFVQSNQTYVFPLSIEEVRSGQLLKISTTSFGYSNGKLMMILNIPLLDPAIYELHKIYSYPVSQTIGRDHGGSAQIQLRADFVLFSKRYYTLARSEDIAKCLIINGSHICKPREPLFDTTFQPVCEAALIMKKKQPFMNCDIEVGSVFRPFWKQTDRGWLYSLPEQESVDIMCDGGWMDMVDVSGVGLLQLKPGCQAHTTSTVMIGHQSIINASIEQISSEKLNVTSLMPAVKRIGTLPRHSMDLSEMKKEIKQIDYHAQEYRRQISLYIILLIGQFVLGAVFLCLLPIIYSKQFLIIHNDVPV